MSLPQSIRNHLLLPAFCAPMPAISAPDLVLEACLAGIIAALPRQNANSREQFIDWLEYIAIERQEAASYGLPIGALAVSFPPASQYSLQALRGELALCIKYGVEIVIIANADLYRFTRLAQGMGLFVYTEAANLHTAELAVHAMVDGIIALTERNAQVTEASSPFACIPSIRKMFSGTILVSDEISNGAGIRCAEILGADLAYISKRFLATQECKGEYMGNDISSVAELPTVAELVESLTEEYYQATYIPSFG